MLVSSMSSQTALCAILSMIAPALTPPLSLGCQSFFLNCVQKTVETAPHLSSISSSSMDLNGVRLVQQPLVVHEQAERTVIVDQLPLAARALAALPPEVFEVGLPDVARPHPPAVDGLREYQEGGVLSVPVRLCSTTFSQRPTNPHVASSVTDNLRGRSPERCRLDVLAYSYSPC